MFHKNIISLKTDLYILNILQQPYIYNIIFAIYYNELG